MQPDQATDSLRLRMTLNFRSSYQDIGITSITLSFMLCWDSNSGLPPIPCPSCQVATYLGSYSSGIYKSVQVSLVKQRSRFWQGCHEEAVPYPDSIYRLAHFLLALLLTQQWLPSGSCLCPLPSSPQGPCVYIGPVENPRSSSISDSLTESYVESLLGVR